MAVGRRQANRQFKDFPYPPGTQPNIRHDEIARYVQSYADHFGIGLLTSYNTRVEKVEKIHGRWRLALRSIEAVPLSSSQVRERRWVEVSACPAALVVSDLASEGL